MLGMIVILSFSWALVYYTLGQSLNVLGFTPFSQRIKELLSGFALAGILCILCQLLEASLGSYRWVLNPNLDLQTGLYALWWDFRSVLTEELLFRGVLLYWLIYKTNTKKGILLSSVAFGIYHWFSMGLFGQVMPMLIVFIGTGLMGAVWAYAFSKTKSVFLPVGMHLGWNFTINTIFSKGPLGSLILLQSHPPHLEGWGALLNLSAWLLVVPLLLYLYVRYFVKTGVRSGEFVNEILS